MRRNIRWSNILPTAITAYVVSFADSRLRRMVASHTNCQSLLVGIILTSDVVYIRNVDCIAYLPRCEPLCATDTSHTRTAVRLVDVVFLYYITFVELCYKLNCNTSKWLYRWLRLRRYVTDSLMQWAGSSLPPWYLIGFFCYFHETDTFVNRYPLKLADIVA